MLQNYLMRPVCLLCLYQDSWQKTSIGVNVRRVWGAFRQRSGYFSIRCYHRMVQEKETLACISKVSIKIGKSIVFIPRYHADNLFRVQHFVRSPRFDRYEIRLQHHDRSFAVHWWRMQTVGIFNETSPNNRHLRIIHCDENLHWNDL